MKIPWYFECVISFVLITIVCHTSYKDGYHEGYWKAVKDIGKAINGVCELKRIEHGEGLVKCKDCKYNDDRDWTKCPFLYPKDDDFCSRGERIEEFQFTHNDRNE